MHNCTDATQMICHPSAKNPINIRTTTKATDSPAVETTTQQPYAFFDATSGKFIYDNFGNLKNANTKSK
jgi:hypothetical protein